MIGDDENPGTPTAAPPPQGETTAAPEPVGPRVIGTASANEAAASRSPTEATPAGEAPRTLHLSGDPHRRRRRRRRRPHGPRPEGAAPDPAAAPAAMNEAAPAPTTQGDKPAVQPPPRRMRIEAITAGGEFILAALPVSDRPRRRRRRRRGARPEGEAARGAEGAVATAAGEGAQQERRDRGPHRRGNRDQRRGDRHDGNRPRGDGPGRDDQRREGQPREGENRDRDRGPRRGKGGKPFGKRRDREGHDGRRDKPAPKLYSFESVVDRGFEDVALPPPAEGDAPTEGGTRRIDWTIVKRTVADQRAAKTVSAQYILKRDGEETEFPNLGAARAAVNKTIVHPEKLTRPKADYPSTKK